MKPAPRTFRYPEAMSSEDQIDENILRLKSWAMGQYVDYIEARLHSHECYLRAYQRTAFRGRYKTYITVFHERAKVTLLKIIYDKSKGKRGADTDRNLLGGSQVREVSQTAHG